MEKQMIYHDLVINNQICNLKCEYCESFGFSVGTNKLYDAKLDTSAIFQLMVNVLHNINAPILKISGGELFVFRNVVGLIKKLSSLYDHIHVITNGTLLTRKILDELSEIENISLNISLDGHTKKMNAMRFHGCDYIDHILDAVFYGLEKQIPIEVTSVITNTNFSEYFYFLDFLSKSFKNVLAVPIPVRGKRSLELFSAENRGRFADMLDEHYGEFSQILPFSRYCERLSQFLRNPNYINNHRCLIPAVALQVFDNGKIVPCPLGWTSPIVDLFKEDSIDIGDFDKGIYRILLHKNSLLEMCMDCFSNSDCINMFLHGEATVDALSCFPMFRDSNVQRILQLVRNELVKKELIN